MTVTNTSLLGLALPTTGTESGVWGDDVNNGLTILIDVSVAGTNNITQDSDITLSVSNGNNSSTFTSTATNSTVAQYSTLNCTGARGAIRNIIAPASSRTFVVINNTTGGFAIVIKKSGGTGVSIAPNETAIVYYDSVTATDYVKVSSTVNVSSFSAGTTGFTPSTATTGAVTLAGTLITSNGGTGLSSYTAGDLPYYASGTALSKLGIGSSGQILTSTGSAPQWSTLSGVAVTSFSAGTTGFTPSTATTGAVTLAGTLNVANGGTGVTTSTGTGSVVLSTSPTLVTPALGTPSSVTLTNATGLPISTGLSGLTTNGVAYATSTSALATGSALTFDGTNLGVSGNANFGNGGSSTYGGYSVGGRIFSLAASGGTVPAISGSTDTTTNSTAIRAYTKEYANDTSYAFDIQTGNGTGVTTQKLQMTWGANGLWNSTGLKLATNLGLGGTAPTSSGTGITFPATQSASSDANTLDDYEKGIWTPTLNYNFTITGTATATGTYTKIGRTVYITWLITVSSGGSITAATGWQMQNCLPFSVSKAGYGVFGIDNNYGASNNGYFQAASTTLYGSVGWTGAANATFSGSATYIV